MKKWLKRIRGVVSMGLTWAAAWSPFGAILGLVLWVVIGGTPLLNTLVGFVATAATLGFVGGAAFSAVLGIAERRRRFDEMSLPRFAAWGALGGLSVQMVMWLTSPWAATLGDFLSFSIPLALLGAGSSAGSLALARRADDRELLEDGADVADAGLTEEETRKLLGEMQ